jgi:hypothetical protein
MASGVHWVKRAQSLNQQGKNVSILFIESDGLPLDCREYLSVLREVCPSVNVMRILDEVRGDPPAVFEVNLRFAQTIRGMDEMESKPVRCRKYGNEMKKLPFL